MPIRRNATARGVLIALLVLAFLSVPVTCAAMVAAPVAPTHPCCPNPPHPDSDRCPKGCISTIPMPPPESATSTIPFAVVAVSDPVPAGEESLPEWAAASSDPPLDFALFPHHHQLLL